MKKLYIVLLLALLTLPALAQEDGKEKMLQTLRSHDYVVEAKTLERFVTIKASPEVWAAMEAENYAGQKTFMNWFSNIASVIDKIGANMGWGDVSSLDSDSPLVDTMLDSWKGKIAFSIDLSAEYDLKFKSTLVDNMESVFFPLEYATTFKPRGGCAFVNIKVDPAASNLRTTISNDGNPYNILMPAYTTYKQNELSEMLKRDSSTAQDLR